MIKLKKVMMITFALLLFASSYSQQIQANASQTVEAAEKDTENTLKSQQETNLKNGKEAKTTEETLTITEKKAKEESNAPPILMTEETVKKNNLIEIGTTKNGTKIWSSASKEVVDAFIKNPINYQTRATGNSSGMLTWMGTYSTPMIFLDGIGWVYCIEPYEVFPSGNWYDDGEWMLDDGLQAILVWGFPQNHGGQHGLSDEDAYLRTFVASNAYLGNYNRNTVTSYEDVYVNMLIDKGDTRDIPHETYTVHSPQNRESHYNMTTNRLETELYHITGGAGQFWLEQLPAGFYMVGEDGNPYSSLSIGSRFRLVTNNLTYAGQVNFDVKTNITPSAAIRFRSPGVQNLVSLGSQDPLPAFGTHAIFKAAGGYVEGTKTRQDDTLNQNYNWDHRKLSINFSGQGLSKNYDFDSSFKFKTDLLLPGEYVWTETNTDNGTVIEIGTGNITIVPGQTIRLTADNTPTNRVAGGTAEGTKIRVDNTKNNNYKWDYKKLSVVVTGNGINETYPLDKNYQFKTDRLSLGTYTWTEVNNDAGTITTIGSGTFTIKTNNEIVRLAGANAPTNEVAGGTAEGTKVMLNNSTEDFKWDYKKLSVVVTGNGINETYPLDKNYHFKTDRLSLGTYTWTEVNNDAGTITAIGRGTFTIKTNNEIVRLTGANAPTNEVAYTEIEGIKLDARHGTPIYKPATFGLYEYNKTTETIGKKIAESDVNKFTAMFSFKHIQIGKTATRDVIIKELTAPDGYFLDEAGVVLTLTTASHKKTIKFEYYNVPQDFFQPNAIK
ncbi:MAG: hypothetical protein ACRCZK_03590, partial [Oscillospiraceae bacterium]